MPSAKHKKHRDAPASSSLSALTDLLIAIELGDDTKVKSLLKQSKEIVDGPAECENASRIPIFKAIANQHVGCLRLLIEAGAEVNRFEQRGTSPLMEACKAIDTAKASEMVRQLVFARAALDLQDNEGFTPLMRASLLGVHEGALRQPPPSSPDPRPFLVPATRLARRPDAQLTSLQ